MPSKEDTIRKAITDAHLKDELFLLFESGNSDRGEIRGIIGKKFKLRHDRFYKVFDVAHMEWAKLKEKAQYEAIVDKQISLLKAGLKSDIELDLRVQEIAFNKYQSVKDGHKVVKIENTTQDQLKAIDMLYKRRGLYVTKVANTDKDGNDAPQQPIIQLPVGSYIALPNDTE